MVISTTMLQNFLPRDRSVLVPIITLVVIVTGIIHGVWTSLRGPVKASDAGTPEPNRQRPPKEVPATPTVFSEQIPASVSDRPVLR
jgi:hypothetical protein